MIKSLVVINPISGNKKGNKIDFSSYFNSCKIIQWNAPTDDIIEIVTTELQQDTYQQVIVAGGDGTINKVAQTLIHTPYTLGIIPLGSGNGLARHLKIPLSLIDAINVIKKGNVKTIDACKINDNYFFCTSGIGFDAHIGHLFATAPKRGFSTYFKLTINQFLKYKNQEYKLQFNGTQLHRKAFLITFANANQYGNNAYIAPNAKIDDGLLDVVILKPFRFYHVPSIAFRLFAKTIYDSKHIETFKTKELTVTRATEDIAHYDGEPCVLPSNIIIKTIPAAINVLVP